MIQFANQLNEDMERSLRQVALQTDSEAVKARMSFEVVEQTLHKLKDFIRTYQFKSIAEEIEFFKKIKPQFYHVLIYYGEMAFIESNRPASDRKMLVIYLRKAVERNSEFIERHKVLHSYYMLGHNTFDEALFTRNAACPSLYPEYNVDLDPTFSTGGSSILSSLMAYEKVNDELVNEIEYLKNGNDTVNSTGDKKGTTIIWTDSKSDLIELAYALHSRGSINKGSCQVQQIITALEIAFKIKTGNFYRTFQSMRIRKKNRTVLLDSLKESLIKRMDDTDFSF